MKTVFVILSLLGLAACQASVTSSDNKKDVFVEAKATIVPAADNSAELDYTSLEKDFPVLAEMEFNVTPSKCNLFKPISGGDANENGLFRYVLTSELGSRAAEPYYQVAVNGKIRKLKRTYAKDYGPRKIRYLQTVDTPIVDVLVEIESLETPVGNIRHKGMIGRIKAWDEDTPLLCDYNRIRVEGDCEI